MSIDAGPRPLQAGDAVADFDLYSLDGGRFTTVEARQQGMLLIVLFKTGCGTCQYSAPFLQRLHEQYAAHSGGRFQVIGVSQDDAATTREFAAQHGGLTFPLLLDTDLEASERYAITHVPNLYLLDAHDTIQRSVLGHFSRDEFNGLARIAATAVGVPYAPIVRDEDDAPALKPG
jgi:peroxiredoxin